MRGCPEKRGPFGEDYSQLQQSFCWQGIGKFGTNKHIRTIYLICGKSQTAINGELVCESWFEKWLPTARRPPKRIVHPSLLPRKKWILYWFQHAFRQIEFLKNLLPLNDSLVQSLFQAFLWEVQNIADFRKLHRRLFWWSQKICVQFDGRQDESTSNVRLTDGCW